MPVYPRTVSIFLNSCSMPSSLLFTLLKFAFISDFSSWIASNILALSLITVLVICYCKDTEEVFQVTNYFNADF